MKLDSPKVIVDKSSQDVYDFLNEVENFKRLMPENISKFEVIEEDTFLFALTGMPEITLKKKEEDPPNQIIFGAAGGKIDFSLSIYISEIKTDKSEVKLVFNGEFNPMMAMMIKGPIGKFIETLSTNIPDAI